MKKYLLYIWCYLILGTVGWAQNNPAVESQKEPQTGSPFANHVPDAEEKKVTVFPNPSTGVVYVTTSGFKGKRTELRVMNVIGNLVHREYLNDDETNKKIDLSKFASGLYYVKLQTDDFSEIRKVIVK